MRSHNSNEEVPSSQPKCPCCDNNHPLPPSATQHGSTSKDSAIRTRTSSTATTSNASHFSGSNKIEDVIKDAFAVYKDCFSRIRLNQSSQTRSNKKANSPQQNGNYENPDSKARTPVGGKRKKRSKSSCPRSSQPERRVTRSAAKKNC